MATSESHGAEGVGRSRPLRLQVERLRVLAVVAVTVTMFVSTPVARASAHVGPTVTAAQVMAEVEIVFSRLGTLRAATLCDCKPSRFF